MHRISSIHSIYNVTVTNKPFQEPDSRASSAAGGIDNQAMTQDRATPTSSQGQGQTGQGQGRQGGKQYHLRALIELACEADRKTTQRHVDGMSVETGVGTEVHNLYHLYAILSLAHQADHGKANQHYRQWSRLVNPGQSSSHRSSTHRHQSARTNRSEFPYLPTYEQSIAMSFESSHFMDAGLLRQLEAGNSTAPNQNTLPRVPSYDEVMAAAPLMPQLRRGSSLRGPPAPPIYTEEPEDIESVASGSDVDGSTQSTHTIVTEINSQANSRENTNVTQVPDQSSSRIGNENSQNERLELNTPSSNDTETSNGLPHNNGTS